MTIKLQEQQSQQHLVSTNPDAKSTEWIKDENTKQREYDKLCKEELATTVPDDHELETLYEQVGNFSKDFYCDKG